jgi:ankyrin repeat protein
MWLAATQNDMKTLELKVRLGCSVNAADDQGYSALAYGCRYGHIEVVRLCLE